MKCLIFYIVSEALVITPDTSAEPSQPALQPPIGQRAQSTFLNVFYLNCVRFIKIESSQTQNLNNLPCYYSCLTRSAGNQAIKGPQHSSSTASWLWPWWNCSHQQRIWMKTELESMGLWPGSIPVRNPMKMVSLWRFPPQPELIDGISDLPSPSTFSSIPFLYGSQRMT